MLEFFNFLSTRNIHHENNNSQRNSLENSNENVTKNVHNLILTIFNLWLHF